MNITNRIHNFYDSVAPVIEEINEMLIEHELTEAELNSIKDDDEVTDLKRLLVLFDEMKQIVESYSY